MHLLYRIGYNSQTGLVKTASSRSSLTVIPLFSLPRQRQKSNEKVSWCNQQRLLRNGVVLSTRNGSVRLMRYSYAWVLSCIKCWQSIVPLISTCWEKSKFVRARFSTPLSGFIIDFCLDFLGGSECHIAQLYLCVENHMKTVATITVCCPSNNS